MREEKNNTSVKLQYKCKLRRGFSDNEETRRNPTVIRGILNLVEFQPNASGYDFRLFAITPLEHSPKLTPANENV